jgi:hypothetical protein
MTWFPIEYGLLGSVYITVELRPHQDSLEKEEAVESDGVSHENLVHTCAGSSIHQSLASAYVTVERITAVPGFS